MPQDPAVDDGKIVQVGGDQHNHYHLGGENADDLALSGGRIRLLRPIAELDDPFALEVHRAITVEGSGELPALPRYVPREHDGQLAERVKRAVSGSSTIAVLVAGSSTGKSRACWEAIRAGRTLPAEWRLWHPIYPSRPRALLRGLDEVTAHTVVWLNELQRYVLTEGPDLGEEVAAALRVLLDARERAPVLILGSLWTEFYNVLTAAAQSGKPDVHANARQLLVGNEIVVPEEFSKLALDDLKAVSGQDLRLELAVAGAEGGRVAQFLAGVPEVRRRYDIAPPAAKALIHVSMDARRLGHGPLLSRALLGEVAPGYLVGHLRKELSKSEDWLDAALGYCDQPCLGVDGPLTHDAPLDGRPASPSSPYRLADSLEQAGRTERFTELVPAKLWSGLVEHAPKPDCFALGQAAWNRGFYRFALRFFLADGGCLALRRAAAMLCDLRRDDEALAMYERAAGLGDPSALHEAARMLQSAGKDEEALALIRRAAQYGGCDVLMASARMLREAGQIDEALDLYEQAAKRGATHALRLAAEMMNSVVSFPGVFRCS